METITVEYIVQDISPVFVDIMYNIWYALYVEDNEISAMHYQKQLDKLKPVVKQLDPINYAIYEHCEFDWDKYRHYIDGVDEIGLEM